MKSVAMVKVHVSLPVEFLQDLDERAAALWMSRSSYIRLALMEKMQRQSLVAPPGADPMEPYIKKLQSLDTAAPDTITPGSL